MLLLSMPNMSLLTIPARGPFSSFGESTKSLTIFDYFPFSETPSAATENYIFGSYGAHLFGRNSAVRSAQRPAFINQAFRG